MLQRIQTIWLLFAAACVFLTLKFSTYTGTAPDLTPQTFVNGTYSIALLACTIAVGLLAFIAIFLFKNRRTQLWLIIFAIVLQLLLIFLYYLEIKKFPDGTVSLSAVLHAGTLVFLTLAAKGVNSDEKLIRESSRLR